MRKGFYLALLLCIIIGVPTANLAVGAYAAEAVVGAAVVAPGANPNGLLRDDPVRPPSVDLDPASIEVELITGTHIDTVVTVTNNNDRVLNFTVEPEIIQNGRDRDDRALRGVDGQGGPDRDNPGDLIGQFGGNVNGANQYSSCVGWDWDNERMWVSNYSNATAAAYTHDGAYQNFREVIRINPGNCMDGAWADGLLFLGNWANASVNRYNAAGQNIGAINFPFAVYGIAADVENERLFVLSGNDQQIKVFNLDGNGNVNVNQPIGSINNHMQFHNNMQAYGLEWVPKHPDGQLWMTSYSTLRLYQIAVNEANWTCTGSPQNWQYSPGQEQPYCAVAHDGKNMWASGYGPATIRIYDDGVTEMYWLLFSPEAGAIEAGQSAEIAMTLDGYGLVGGTYRAVLHVRSDDQDQPDAQIDLTMHVNGAPDIDVTWKEDMGFPNSLDWNRRYADLFCGGRYEMSIAVKNVGSEDLAIDGVNIDGNDFTVAEDQFVVAAKSSHNLVITFNAPANAPGAYEPILTLSTNDPDEREWDVQLHAQAMLPPVLELTANEYETDLQTGDTENYRLGITNRGDATLRWSSEMEIIQEGRDATERTLRGVDGGASRGRDDAGELLGQFNGINAANQYCSPVGWDWDAEMMWVSNYSTATAAAYTHDDGYQNFQEVVRIQPGNCMDGTWADGMLWLPTLGNSSCNRYNAAGQNVGAVQFAFGIYGMGADVENELLFVLSSNDWQIHVFPLDGNGGVGQQIGSIGNHQQYHGNQQVYGLEWVAKHPDGQLWMNTYNDGRTHEIAVNTDNWTCTAEVRSFQAFPANEQPYISVAHDGHNLWAGGYTAQNIRVYDDGVSEMYWLGIDPREGEIESGANANTNVLFSAYGLGTGTYIADLHFLSNDPVNPNQVFRAIMNVSGDADIDVTWDEEDGFPDAIDWNARYDDLFTNGPYDMTVKVANVGTEDLDINQVFTDNGYFTPSPEEIVLGAGEEHVFTVTFNAPMNQPADYNATLSFVSNDHDEEQVDIRLHANARRPPVLVLDNNAYETDLTDGETDDYIVNLANQGEAVLRWETNLVVVQDGRGRDAESRSLRGVDGSAGPRRDEAGEVLAEYRLEWPSVVGLAYDPDNNVVWGQVNVPTGILFAVNPDNGEIVRQFDGIVDHRCCLTYFEGRLYINGSSWDAQTIYVYDTDGNQVERINTPFPVWRGHEHFTIGGEGDNAYFMIRGSDGNNSDAVTVYSWPDLQQVGRIQDAAVTGDQATCEILWTPDIRQGQLWVDGRDQIYQLSVDENWGCELVQTFQVESTSERAGLAFDGHDIWRAVRKWSGGGPEDDHTMLQRIDNGVSEAYWLTVTPESGEIAGRSDTDVNLHFDATGVFGGTYIGDLHFLSNDPAHPDQVFQVTLNVTGAPHIEVTWAPALGFPDQVDFNAMYHDELYVRVPYAVPLKIKNVGTEDLELHDIICEEGTFTTDWDGDAQGVIAPDEDITINAIMNAAQPDVYEGNIIIQSNDADGDVSVFVRGEATNPPMITLSRVEVSTDMVTGDIETDDIEIGNDGDAVLRFTTDIVIVQAPERDQNVRRLRGVDGSSGPSRDDPGELIAEFGGNVNVANQYSSCVGWDWDNERMWVSNYSSAVAAAYTHDANYENFAEVIRIQPGNCMDGCWADGLLLMGNWANSAVNRYNAAGQNIGALNFPFGVYGIAADVENERLFVLSGNDNIIYVYDLDGAGNVEVNNPIGRINNHMQFHANMTAYGLEWVPMHPDGQLWMTSYNDLRVHEIAVDEDNWTCTAEVQSWQYSPGQEQPYCSVAHDGQNMWASGYGPATIRVYDDGVSEVRWVDFTPTEGEIQPGDSQMGELTLNAAGLFTFTYIADVNFISNDPRHAGEEPDASIRVTINVSGVPNILVTDGGPEEGQVPEDFGIVYFDYPESQLVQVENVGTEDLELRDVAVDGNNPDFYVNGDDLQGFVIAAGEIRDLAITYAPNADRGEGVHSATLLFATNDPRYPNGYPVRVTGHALTRPIISLEFDRIDRELDEGQAEDVVFEVANEGRSQLTWASEIEITGEPGRDANSRALRGVDGRVGPHRDDPGDLIGQFQGINNANQYCSPVGWDWDNEMMWVANYSQAIAVAYTHDRGYDNFEEVVRIQPGNCMDGCWIDGTVWLPTLGNAIINKYNSAGQNVGNVNMGFGVYGLAADIENELLFVLSSNDWNIHVFQLDGNGAIQGGEIGAIRNHAQYHGNQQVYGLEWVPKHPDGKLWMNTYNDGRTHQIAVDEANWTCTAEVQSFQAFPANEQPYISVAHDGYNLWAGGYTAANIRIYDDGNMEAYWLGMDPMEGTLEAGATQEVALSFSSVGNIGGDYSANVHFLSNDPATPDKVLPVTLSIHGMSVFGSEPAASPLDEAALIDFPDGYVGGEVTTPVVFNNGGSDTYEITAFEVTGDHAGDFGLLADLPIQVVARQEVEAAFYFRPSATGPRTARIHITTNAMNVEGSDVFWDVNGYGLLPPSMVTDPANNIPTIFARADGDVAVGRLVIGNEAGQDRDSLRFRIEGVEVDQQRDANSRALRSVSGAVGPLRDAPGDSVARIELRHNGQLGISHDAVNDVMWVCHTDQVNGTGYYTGYQWDGEQVTGIVADWQTASLHLGGTYYNGVLYGTQWTSTAITRWDTDGNRMGDVGINFTPMTFACDQERGLLFVNELAQVTVHVLDVNNNFQEVARIANFLNNGGNGDFRGRLNWVPEHRQGHLWSSWIQAVDANGCSRIYQTNVNENQDGNWTADVVQSFPVKSDIRSPGISSDGRHMWVGNNQATSVCLYEDAAEGPPWLTIAPEKGVLAAGAEASIALSCDPTGLADGDYPGRLLITSNDPNNAELWLDITLNVGNGPQLHHFAEFSDAFPNGWHQTAASHSIVVTGVTFDNEAVPSGWEIGVFTPGGVLAGGALWSDGADAGLAAWGDDPATNPVEGFTAGQRMSFKIWDNQAEVEHVAGATVAEGSIDWSDGGMTGLALGASSSYTCRVPFGAGWNLISINVVPSQDMYARQEGPDVRRMMNQYRNGNAHHVILMKNERGQFYSPAFRDFCNIPFWNLEEGYQVRMDQAMGGEYTGAKIADGADVQITTGWNMIAYFPSYPLTCTRANGFYPFSSIIDNVILVKNGFGDFAAPRNRFSNMRICREGMGFQINVSANVTLNYPAAQDQGAAINPSIVAGPWSEPVSTGNNMSVLLTSIDGAKNGDAVAAFDASGRLVGLGKLNDGMAGLAVWGDDPSTEAVDGLVKGEAFTLKLYSVETGMIVNLSTGTIATGAGLVYETDGFSALTASSIAIPSEYSLGQNYPNPFNMVTRLSFGLPEDAQVSIRVFDLAGRSVATLVSGELKAGTHSATWNAEGFTSGIYLVKMETPSFNATRKVTLVK